MGRPPLDIGEHGDIRTYCTPATDDKPERWRAITNYRGSDGKTVRVEKWAADEEKALKALDRKLKELSGAGSGQITRNTRINVLADMWLEHVRQNYVGTTYDMHRSRVHTHIKPHIGHLRIQECTVGRLEDLFELLAGKGLAASTRRIIRSELAGILQIAVRRDILKANPVRSMERIMGGRRKKPRAMTAEQVAEFLAAVDGDYWSVRADLPDLLRFMLGTGVRIGEALGVRWKDVNLGDEPLRVVDPVAGDQVIPPRSVWINGNLVYIVRQGIARHEGKTYASQGLVGLPGFLHTLLVVRKPADVIPDEPVFPGAGLGWRSPKVVGHSIKRMRERISPEDDPDKWAWLVSHVLRKTVATALDEAGQSARAIADQLRQADVTTAQRYYLGRGMVNPEAAAVLDAMHRPQPSK